ncbi:MAG: DUF4124 domain-containing protein [Gammaproteobacteria bacterium]|nr:DUF4124 domain-containing protein [Gammaproteobacteria bacterium]MBV9697278.1 DUF4124 domain-containing protein [Gammaproteobacteria bacterium]
MPLCAALLCASALCGAQTTPKKGPVAYRWVDDQGVVHYGDAIPPQYAQQARSELNREGIEVGHSDAQKTSEQLKAEQHARADVLRQRQHDSFLVSTYTSVRDIEALRDSRLTQLQGQRTAAQQYVDSLHARLGALQSRALNFAPYSSSSARRMPDDLAENLVRTLNEVRTQTAALAAQNDQEKSLREQFDADIQRYKELHTIHSQ